MRKKIFILGGLVLFFILGCSSKNIKLKEQTLYPQSQSSKTKPKNTQTEPEEIIQEDTQITVEDTSQDAKNLPYTAQKFNLRDYYTQYKSTIKTPKHILMNIPRTGNMKFLTDPILAGYHSAYNANPAFNIKTHNNKLDIVDSQDDNIISDNNKKLIEIDKQTKQSFLYTPLKKENQNKNQIEYDLNIGPIVKKSIQHLIKEGTLLTPTVSLNYSSFGNNIPINNLYEFAISHEDEAHYLAQLLQEKGYYNILIISNDSHWAKRISDRFIKSTNEFNGAYLYNEYKNDNNIKSISNTVSQALNVTNSSVQKYKELLKKFQKDHKKKTNILTPIEKLELTDKEKQKLQKISNKNNIDAVFALGNNKQIGSIRTFMSYFLANNIPLFTTSLVNIENIEQFYVKALNGVYFIDLPIFASPNQFKKVQKEYLSQTGINGSYTELRLFAMGNDLFYFSQIITDYWQHYDKNSFAGYTGKLYLKNNQIRRVPNLFQYDNKSNFKEIQLEINIEKKNNI